MKLIMENFKKFINEEEDAMDFADMGDEGAGIENIRQPEGEEPIDVLMDVKARLAGMSKEEMMQLAADLDVVDMVTALRHILSDKMYDPRDQSPLEERKFTDEQRKEYNNLLSNGIAEFKRISHDTAQNIALGTPAQKEKYLRARRGYRDASNRYVPPVGDAEARRTIYT